MELCNEIISLFYITRRIIAAFGLVLGRIILKTAHINTIFFLL